MLRRVARFALVGGALLLVAIQAVPYGRSHTNPPVRAEPAWDSPRTRGLADAACYACHSNETVWPWYSNIAPASWLIQRDVDEGRAEVNFSKWDRPQREAGESAKTVREGEMPPVYYAALHPSAQLSPSERQDLILGLEVTLGRGR